MSNPTTNLSSLCIPDISYHLIFCFLSLKELPLVARCSKEWKRIVTESSFLRMFCCNDELKLDHRYIIQQARNSPFYKVIRKLKLCAVKNFGITFSLIQFSQLVSLEFKVLIEKSNFDITPVFQALAPRLHHLKVRFFKYSNEASLVSFFHFQKALDLLTCLKSLTFIGDSRGLFTDMSFLSHMKELERFQCDFFIMNSTDYLIRLLSCLPNLNHLNLYYLYYYSESLARFQNLITSLGNSKLKHIGHFANIPQHEELQCFNILDQMKHLETIDFELYFYSTIPTSFGKWIQHLKIQDKIISAEDVCAIIHLPHLKSLDIENRWQENNLKIEHLICGLSTRLENLKIDANHGCCGISFKTFNHCTNLKQLTLKNFYRMESDWFINDELLQCAQLESITLQSCGMFSESFIARMKNNFKIFNVQG
jgi:hypothetical protein